MSNSDVPAGQAGGLNNVSEATELPPRLRVHALAKLMAVTSRQVLDTLAELGEPAKGVQSSIDRDIALRVIQSLAPDNTVSATEITEAVTAEPELEPESPFGALPLFAAPSPMFLPPEPVTRKVAPPAEKPTEDDDADDSDDLSETKRRRRRGRRGRGRGRGADDETLDGLDVEDGDSSKSADPGDGQDADDTPEDSAENSGAGEDSVDDDAGDEGDFGYGDEGSASSRRRRRRRRRKDSSDSDGDNGDSDDPPNTVTKIRDVRVGKVEEDVNQGIQGVRGSTRLEAKRQRRRDGRDAGRRRTPVLSEAEFLTRRESVERTMVVRQHGERSEIGVLEDGVLVEHFVTSSGGSSLVGNVYLGRVQNVLPSMEAAFVDIGRGRNAVLYAGEVDWDAAGLAGKARRIEQALSSGDSILVQVTKDPIGHKGARLTTQISLPGRFLVYVPSGGTHGISRKLPDIERRRLKDLLKEIVPDDAGVIIRTASEGVSQEALERDVRRLQAQWDVVKTRADVAASASTKGTGKSAKAPELLYEEPDLMIKVVRDQFNEDFAKLVVSGDDAWDTLYAYVSHVAPELAERLYRHVGTTDVFSEYRIDEQLTKALDRKVWLPSGGTLVIDRTEAMTVVDVNTGKFTGSGGNLEETVTRNNLEAAEEIVRQLRLRDVGGIIVIDFIDMVLESNRDLVVRRLTECLGRDRTRHQVAEVTSLGLVQMTRKRVGVGLLDAFSTPCEHCRGRGVMVSTDPVEPRTDGAQHSSGGGGRRRGRGSDQGDHGDRGGNGGPGGQRNGSTNNGSGNGGGNEGGSRRGGSGASSEQTVSRQLADVAAAANGRPLLTAPRGAHPVESEAAPAEVPTAHEPVLEQPRVEPSASVIEAVVPEASEEQPEPADEWSSSVIVVEPARPARRRRRAASRPAGPPSGG
jgi:ribonuclease E